MELADFMYCNSVEWGLSNWGRVVGFYPTYIVSGVDF